MFSNFKKGIHMTAGLNADGRYEVVTSKGHGLSLATYQVCVIPPPPPINVNSTGQAPPIKQYPNIPRNYRDPATSGLTLIVQQGDNLFDINM